ncbi:MAG: tetratricopeptide repeat protein [bacterium]|nr:tetratricopeptide repeat protein [bacterium]
MADSLCREALRMNPNDGEAYFYLALSQSMLQNYEDAYGNFAKAAELKPERSEMAQTNIDRNFAEVFNQGVDASTAENNDYAIECFQTATLANPQNPLGFTNLAKAYWARAQDRREMSLADQFIENADLALENMAIGLELSTDPDTRAATALLMANILGNIYVSIPNVDKEMREPYLTRYRDFTAAMPEAYIPHETFGEVLLSMAEELRSNRRSEDWYHDFYVFAGEGFGKAADVRNTMGQEDDNILYLAGTAYLNAEMYPEAADYLQRAVELNPNQEQAYYYIEYCNYQTKNYDAAIEAALFLTDNLGSAEANVYQVLFMCYKAKAELADEANDSAGFVDNRTRYEDAYLSYATYAGLDEISPPPLISKEERAEQERIDMAIFEKDNIAVITGEVVGKFIRGSIINKNDEDYEYIELAIDLLDADGEPIGTALAEIEGLTAGEESTFSAAFIEDGIEGFLITDLLAE